jgi:monofunctional biosynthetic peptidoglycan transglycosylase
VSGWLRRAWARARVPLWRALAVLGLCSLALELSFALCIAATALIDPASSAFQRSEALRLLIERGEVRWRQEWVPWERISIHLKRAVIASEDSTFVEHHGIDWAAVEGAWERNQRAEARAARQRTSARAPKVVGGSTITQQLAKNLFLSGERTVWRKAQEAALTLMLEAALSKRRILEIYLNSVEWGEGVFGIQAAARHYYRTDASRLGPDQAARLAVMLPAPKRFERQPGSPYLAARAGAIIERMPEVQLP